MKSLLSPRTAALALGLAATAAPVFAADNLDDDDQSGWFIRLGGRISSGVKAELRDTKPVSAITAGVYDDGYVLPDSGGSATLTQNWGYQNASQVQNGGNDLVMHQLQGGPRVGNRTGLENNPLYGGELVGGFEFVRFDIGRREAKFGFELGYSYSQLSIKDHATDSRTATFITDTYALDAAVPGSPISVPPPGYAGSFDGNPAGSPVIGLVKRSGTSSLEDGTSTLDTRLDSDFHTLRLGPWIEIPLSGRVNLALSLGYCTIYSSSELNLNESVSYANPAAQAQAPASISGHYLRTHWSPGGYAQLRATYRLTKHVGVYVGGDFQYNTGVTIDAPGRQAKIDFGTTYGAVAGVSFGF